MLPAIRSALIKGVPLVLTSTAVSATAIAQASATPAGPLTTPVKADDRYFFATPAGDLYVRKGRTGANRSVLRADLYGMIAPSPNGKYLAYTVPVPGSASKTSGATVRIRDVDNGRDLSDVLDHVTITSAPWTQNNRGFFYSKLDTAEHRERVYYHLIGEPTGRDQVIYSRPDAPDWHYDVRVSDDGHFAVFTITHPQDDHTRLYFIDLDNPGKPSLNAPIVKLVDAFTWRYAFIDNGGTTFFLQTDREAPRGRVVLANTDDTRESRWRPIIRESADTLRWVRTAGDEYIIAVYRNGTQSIARVYSPPTKDEMKRQMDSLRKAREDSAWRRGRRGGGDRGREPGDSGPPGGMGAGGRGGRPMGGPGGDEGAFGFRLHLRREIPVPANTTIVDMTSVADDPEVLYTVKTADGRLIPYVFNVKSGSNAVFSSNVSR